MLFLQRMCGRATPLTQEEQDIIAMVIDTYRAKMPLSPELRQKIARLIYSTPDR